MKKIILCLLILASVFCLFATDIPNAPTANVPSAPTVFSFTVQEKQRQGELMFAGSYHSLLKTGDINTQFTYYITRDFGVMVQLPLYCFTANDVDHFYIAGAAVKRLGGETFFCQLGVGYVVLDYTQGAKEEVKLRLRGATTSISACFGICEEIMMRLTCSEWYMRDFNTNEFYPCFNAELAIGLRF